MENKIKKEPHVIVIGAKEWSSQGTYVLARIFDIVAVPMFWHIGRDYQKNGFEEFRKDEEMYQGAQFVRTLVPAIIGFLGFLYGDQRVFAIGAGFMVGGLLDMVISTILVTGIKVQAKAKGIDTIAK